MTSSLLSLSSVELRRRIGTREISPVELLDAAIARIAAIDPAVNAIAATDFRRARREAKAAENAARAGEALGLLHGLPTGIKDLHETEGLLTTWGSPLHRDHVPTADCAMVANVRRQGAIVVAKTNVPEFGAGANTLNPVWGATGNPFDPMLNAGGSSGGSAVALATDMLPVCTGSDTGGSLRYPAGICGVVGFRPTPGLVPMEARALGWSPISVLGPMGRDVPDTRLLFAAQVGPDDRDPLSTDLSAAAILPGRPADLGRLRIAWTADFGCAPVSRQIRAVTAEKIGRMRHLFHACDEVEFGLGDAHRCFDVIRGQNFVARHAEAYKTDREALGPNIRANYEIAAGMTIADTVWAQAEQTRLFRRFQAVLRDYDLILSPTTPVTPFPWSELYLAELEGETLRNYYHWLALAYVVTLATNPAISLPCGRDHAGMPFGLQVVGRFRGDVALLDAAQAMEAAFSRIRGLERPRPDLAKLAAPRPELKSIVTHPPIGAEDRAAG